MKTTSNIFFLFVIGIFFIILGCINEVMLRKQRTEKKRSIGKITHVRLDNWDRRVYYLLVDTESGTEPGRSVPYRHFDRHSKKGDDVWVNYYRQNPYFITVEIVEEGFVLPPKYKFSIKTTALVSSGSLCCMVYIVAFFANRFFALFGA